MLNNREGFGAVAVGCPTGCATCKTGTVECASCASPTYLTGSACTTYTTCRDIGSSSAAGVYWINPGTGALQMYCNPSTFGGGWTKLESAAWPFFFSTSNWDSYNTGAPDSASYSQVNCCSAELI
jgi:hypothetical protein